MTSENTPVGPKPSATVMVVRPAEAGFELFMVRRHSKSRFMPDRYVFPGGRLEETDWQPATLGRLAGYDPTGAAPIFRDSPGQGAFDEQVRLNREQQAGLYVAAFRELFEEAGVLLAVHKDSQQPLNLSGDESLLARFSASRQLLHQNQLDFIAMLDNEKLLLDLNGLIYFSHWITPVVEPYRFDTRFFLAQAPFDQIAESDHLETTDGIWITPSTAMQRYEAGEFNIAFPTMLHVKWLSQYANLETATTAARAKPVITVMPDPRPTENGEFTFHLPAEIIDRW